MDINLIIHVETIHSQTDHTGHLDIHSLENDIKTHQFRELCNKVPSIFGLTEDLLRLNTNSSTNLSSLILWTGPPGPPDLNEKSTFKSLYSILYIQMSIYHSFLNIDREED